MPVPLLSRIGLLTALFALCFILNPGESLAQTSDDHGNTAATATSLTLGTTVNGVIGPDGDRDIFTFDIPDTVETIDVWIYNEGSISDTVGGLYDASFNEVALVDDSSLSASSTHFFIGASLTPGTYYVVVVGFGDATGPYSLHSMTGEDQGDTREDSASLDVGTTTNGIIGSADDSDLFKIELSDRADIVIYTSGDADTVGVLQDYRGAELAGNDDSSIFEGEFNFFIGEALEPGVYYIEVTAYDTGPYRLHVEQVPDQDADRSQATDLALDSPEFGFINHRNDEDYFSLTVPDTTDVWVYAVGPTDTVGDLQDSNGNRVAYNDDSDLSSGRLSFFLAENLQAGTHYLKVSGVSGNRGPYRVFALEKPDTGDTMATADALDLGIPQTGLIEPSSDTDLYELNLPFAAEVVVYTKGDVDTTGELLSSDGSTLTSLSTDDDSGTDLNFSMRHDLAPGMYYVRVESYGSETGAYALFAEPVSQLTVDGPNLVRRIAGGNDEEYFKLQLDTQADVWIYSFFMDTVGTLYDSDFNVISVNDDSLLSSRSRIWAFHFRESLAAGTYYVNVRSFGTDTGLFGVGAEVIPDHGSSRDTAAPLTLGSWVPGRIVSDGDEDYFRFDLEDEANIIIHAGTSSFDPLVGDVLDSNGEEISVNISPWTISRRQLGFIVQDDFDAGTYYVRVTSNSAVDYTLIAVHDSPYNAFINACQGTTGDPLYACQWHLQNLVDEDEDINVEPAWADGINGTGINVAVVDDGLDYYHEDLSPNVATYLNHDYSGGDDVHTPMEHHGTAVAGLIAARDNGVGVRGVAPRATIYGYNFLTFSTDLAGLDSLRGCLRSVRIGSL